MFDGEGSLKSLDLLFSACAIPLFLAACSGQSVKYQDEREQPIGSGIFSSDSGIFAIYLGDKQHHERQSEADKRVQESGCRMLLDWKDFQQWEGRARDTTEYQEFLGWLEWRAQHDSYK